jgi:hypothetical protein
MGTILESGFREDLVHAHTSSVAAFGTSGACWSATERLAIGTEVRRALEHRDLPPWHAPSANGLIADDHLLPAMAVDAIWRITNHPGTLTNDWYTGIVDALPSPQHYVELVSLVAPLNAIDRFAQFLDLDLLAMPAPDNSTPSGETVAAEVRAHWVPTADVRGANVMKALTGVAGGTDLWNVLSQAQYVDREALLGDLSWSRGTLDRRQIELLAAKTSLVNECFY